MTHSLHIEEGCILDGDIYIPCSNCPYSSNPEWCNDHVIENSTILLSIAKSTPTDRKHQYCHCGRPAETTATIGDFDFYFCESHNHLATPENLISEYNHIITES